MKLANFVDEFPRFFCGGPKTCATGITRPFIAMRQSIPVFVRNHRSVSGPDSGNSASDSRAGIDVHRYSQMSADTGVYEFEKMVIGGSK
jgi:hypothetical protein